MEKAGIPVVTLVTQEFLSLAKSTARSLKYPDLPMVVLPHPFETLEPDAVRKIADEKFEEIIKAVTRPLEVPAS